MEEMWKNSAIIAKRNVDDNQNPISVQLYELKPVIDVHSCIVLNQLPDEFHGIEIEGFTQVYDIDKISTKNFKVDYANGVLYFHPNNIGKMLTINYYGIGCTLLSASRIYTKYDKHGNVLETLEEFIDKAKLYIKAIESLGGAVEVINKLDIDIEAGKELHEDLSEDIAVATPLQQDLRKDINEANTFREQLNRDVADGKILNTDLKKNIVDGTKINTDLIASNELASSNINLITKAGNIFVYITSSQWTQVSDGTFEYNINHKLNSEGIIVGIEDSVTGDILTPTAKRVDKNNILLKSDTRRDVKVVLNASYYSGGVDSKLELIDARKGKATLKDRLDTDRAEINTQLAEKASKNDVAKISSGTPLFASSVGGMTDTTKNYVNTTDGYLYIYSGGSWTKTTVQYQSTGISDNSIKYSQVYSKSVFSNINNDNLFDNPTLENNLNGWLIVNNDGHVATEKTLVDSFSKGAYVPITVTGNSLIQRIPLSKLVTGEYKVRCRKKTSGTNYNGRLIIQLSNSLGTNLFEIYRSSGITTSTMEYTFTFNKETLLATYPTAVYLTISFGHASPTADCTFYEPFIGLTSKSVAYNNFKYEILSTLEPLANSSLANKIATFNGDSICQGVSNGGGYAKVLADTEKLIVENKGIGGGTIAKNTYYTNGTTPRHWICDTVNTMRTDCDYAIFEGGRNDYGVNVPLGTLTTDYTGTIDNTTFYGGLEYLFRQALLKFKGKKIGFIIIHKANAEPYTRNSIGLTMNDYYNAIIETCNKYSIPVCDLYKNSGLITAINELKTSYTDSSDGLHPNALGYELYYVPKISAWMKTL